MPRVSCNCRDRRFTPRGALRGDDAELGQMTAQGVDQHGSLPDQRSRTLCSISTACCSAS